LVLGQLFIMGLAFGVVRLLSGSIWFSVALHVLTNASVWIVRLIQSQGHI
jgi:membrane protease YdiL (CAAX protease family)